MKKYVKGILKFFFAAASLWLSVMAISIMPATLLDKAVHDNVTNPIALYAPYKELLIRSIIFGIIYIAIMKTVESETVKRASIFIWVLGIIEFFIGYNIIKNNMSSLNILGNDVGGTIKNAINAYLTVDDLLVLTQIAMCLLIGGALFFFWGGIGYILSGINFNKSISENKDVEIKKEHTNQLHKYINKNLLIQKIDTNKKESLTEEEVNNKDNLLIKENITMENQLLTAEETTAKEELLSKKNDVIQKDETVITNNNEVIQKDETVITNNNETKTNQYNVNLSESHIYNAIKNILFENKYFKKYSEKLDKFKIDKKTQKGIFLVAIMVLVFLGVNLTNGVVKNFASFQTYKNKTKGNQVKQNEVVNFIRSKNGKCTGDDIYKYVVDNKLVNPNGANKPAIVYLDIYDYYSKDYKRILSSKDDSHYPTYAGYFKDKTPKLINEGEINNNPISIDDIRGCVIVANYRYGLEEMSGDNGNNSVQVVYSFPLEASSETECSIWYDSSINQ